jgi:hypothetical protein
MSQTAKRKGAAAPVRSTVSKRQKLSNVRPAHSKPKSHQKVEDEDQSSFDGFTSDEDDKLDEPDFPVESNLIVNTTNGDEYAHQDGNQGKPLHKTFLYVLTSS